MAIVFALASLLAVVTPVVVTGKEIEATRDSCYIYYWSVYPDSCEKLVANCPAGCCGYKPVKGTYKLTCSWRDRTELRAIQIGKNNRSIKSKGEISTRQVTLPTPCDVFHAICCMGFRSACDCCTLICAASNDNERADDCSERRANLEGPSRNLYPILE